MSSSTVHDSSTIPRSGFVTTTARASALIGPIRRPGTGNDQRTIVDIASRLGRSPAWISTQLHSADIAVAPGGTRRVDVDEEWIEDQYVNQRRSINSIRLELSVSADVVKRVLDPRRIKRRSRGESLTRITDADELRRLYVDEQLTQAAVAKRLGMSATGVGNALHRHGIAVQPVGTELTIDVDELHRNIDDGVGLANGRWSTRSITTADGCLLGGLPSQVLR